MSHNAFNPADFSDNDNRIIINDLLNEAKLPLEFRELFKKILIVSFCR